MVFNTVVLVSVATVSAEAWQRLSCLPERIAGEELIDVLCCLPLQQLGRLALSLWTFFCLPPSLPDHYSYYYYYSHRDLDSDSSSSSSSTSIPYYYYQDHLDDFDSHSD